MRTLLVSHRFPPDGVAGVERITQTLADELTRAGDTISVVARMPTWNKEKPRTVRERLPNGALLYRFTGGWVKSERFLADHERLERLFTMAMLETAPDVVHFMHLLGLSPRFVEIARRHQAAIVVSLQDYFFVCPRIVLRKPSGELCQGPDGGHECARACFPDGAASTLRWGLRTMYFNRLLMMADRIICPSRYVSRYFSAFGADAARTRIIANGVSIGPPDGSDGRSTPSARGRMALTFLGTIVEQKGVHVILDALRLAELPLVDLQIVGKVDDPAYADRLVAQAAQIRGLKIRMHGAYTPGALRSILRDVDCVIVPSQWPETFGIVAREALVQGIPVITSRLGGLPEGIVDGQNGFTFDPGQPAELAAVLRRIHADEKLLEQLRAGARETKVLTVAEHAVAVRAVYQEAIESSNPVAACRGDLDEMAFLHEALLTAEFGTPDWPC